MKMKRIIAGLLAVSMLFMFTACGKKTNDDDSNTASVTNERVLYPDDEDDTETDTEEVSSGESSQSSSSAVQSKKTESKIDNNSSKVLIQKERTSSVKTKTSSVTSKKTTASKKDTDSSRNSSKETSKTSSKSSSSAASSSVSSNTSSKDMSSSAGSSSKSGTDTDTATDTDTDTASDTDTDTLSDTDTDTEPEKILVVYFSRAGEQYNGVIEEGNTAIAANIISNYLGADSKEITPLEDNYPTTYQELVDYAKQEKDNSARPAIAEDFSIISEYDTIFVGYPIWHADMPMIMYTFFESYDFTGKKVIPFCTHAGSGESGTFGTIEAMTAGAEHGQGFDSLGEASQTDRHGVRDNVIAWLEGLGYGV